MEADNDILYNDGKFIFKVLNPEFKDATLVLLSRAFCTEPLVTCINENCLNNVTFLDWIEFIDYWMTTCSQNGLSVIAIDIVNFRVAGALIVRDLVDIPDEFQSKYYKNFKSLSPWMRFLAEMDEIAIKLLNDLSFPGKAADLWLLGVHPDYRGNYIAKNLIKFTLPLIKNAGYNYATIEATSYFTSKAAKSNDFIVLHKFNVKDWRWRDLQIFLNVEKSHEEFIFWIKNIIT
jgi:ribosomal protein S18 acetylase RimI-like enzyme